jgi:hypothetical protein
MLGRGDLDQIGGGRSYLPAQSKALRHPRRDHDDGCCKADRLIDGVSAMVRIDSPMSAKLSSMAGRRPIRSD